MDALDQHRSNLGGSIWDSHSSGKSHRTHRLNLVKRYDHQWLLHPVILFLSGIGIQSKAEPKPVAVAAGSFDSILGMLFTYTRMAMLAIVFGLALLVFKYRKIRVWGFIAIALIPLVIPSSMMHRGEMVSMMDISILIRLIAWYKAIFLIAENPIFGIGFSTWKDIYHSMVPVPNLYAQHAHNVYINLLLEIGVIGTLAYMVVIFKSMLMYHLKAVKPQNDMVDRDALPAVCLSHRYFHSTISGEFALLDHFGFDGKRKQLKQLPGILSEREHPVRIFCLYSACPLSLVYSGGLPCHLQLASATRKPPHLPSGEPLEAGDQLLPATGSI